MVKLLKILFIFCLCFLFTGCSSANIIKEIDYNEFKVMRQDKESFILEVMQTGCNHCEEFAPTLKKVLKDNNLTAYSINLYNLTKDEKNEFDELTKVTGTPTVLFFKDGELNINNRIRGVSDEDDIKRHLKRSGYIK